MFPAFWRFAIESTLLLITLHFGLRVMVLSVADCTTVPGDYSAYWIIIPGILIFSGLAVCSPARDSGTANRRDQVDKDKQRKIDEGIERLTANGARRALQAAKAEISWYSAAYDAQKELLKQRAIDLRDKERIIQNQAIEVARFDHRAEAAKYRLKAKNEYVDGLQKEIEVKRITIQDRDSTIRSQAQQVMNAQWDVEAMKKQIREKDDQHWKLSGQNSSAQKEIAKLKAALANEYTTSDYCCALHTIDRRDQTISALQNHLKQYRDAHESDRKSYESLIATAREHSGTPDAEFVSIVKDWVRTVISRRTQPDHESKSTASHQDECDAHRHIIDLQHELLHKTLQERTHLEKMVDGQKTQINELEKLKDSECSKNQAQLTGEKQHLLDALSKAQRNANDMTSAYHNVEKQRKAAGQQLKDARDLLKTHEAAMDISKTERDRLQAELDHVYQQALNAARESRDFENAAAQTQQELFQTRVKLQIIEHGLDIAGVECDVWRLKDASELAAKLEHIKAAASEQETKLAESCAELSASNEHLKIKLSEQEAEKKDLTDANEQLKIKLSEREAEKKDISAQLTAANEKGHKEHVAWQQSLLKAHNALRAARLESPNLEFKNTIQTLEMKLDVSIREENRLRRAYFDEELRSRNFAASVSQHVEREARARDALNNALGLNKELRNKIHGQAERVQALKAQVAVEEQARRSCSSEQAAKIADLRSRLEAAEDAKRISRGEIQHLTGMLDARDDKLAELEQTKEGLEKKLVLGDDFVEVEEEDVPLLAEQACDEEDEVVIVQEDDVEDFEVEFEEVEVDKDGDGIENENGMPAIRVQ